MIRQPKRAFNGTNPTSAEVHAVIQARRETLDEATQLVTLGKPMPVSWRTGWQAHVDWLLRDRDGSLRVRITVTGPQLYKPYVRNLRMVKTHRVNIR
jgi:hypothetical protein